MPVPDAVKVAITGRKFTAEGPKGKLELELPERTTAALEDGSVVVARENDEKRSKAMHGLARSLINNMVIGVEKGFVKKLEIHGVGFKAAVQGQVINLQLGYSHDINYPIPQGINVTVESSTQIPSKVRTRHSWARLPQKSVPFTPWNPTRAKACATPMRTWCASKANRCNRRTMRPEQKRKIEQKRRWRIRKKVQGTAERPRMSVRFTGRNIYVQFIDDQARRTVASASTRHKAQADRDNLKSNKAAAEAIGKAASEAAKGAGIEAVVFDRSGSRFIKGGKIDVLANAVREGGVKF